MQRISLHYDKVLKGEFGLKRLNFLFVFQVNCPGCFLYGFPLVSKLFEKYCHQISFLGLSTAFEDFELNNEANSRLLVEQGEFVGETKKAFWQQGITSFPGSIRFPIAMDKMAGSTFDYHTAALRVCELYPNFSGRAPFEKERTIQNVIKYLSNQESLSLTFTLNGLRGTPTFLLFNDAFEVVHHSFGYIDYEEMEREIDYLTEKFD
ncbi:MAG TPA: hypothetical protein PKJ63_09345 [Cyclobacteriaceae bacterium]|nr:hypothetical protein [Cyclobacteriaceae bacterium]